MITTAPESAPLTAKDFVTDQEVRWCPGCGDYSILAQVQKVMPQIGVPRENIVIISGIGCSSRFPYYMMFYLKSVYFSFPVQLVLLYLKKYQLLLLFWVILFSTIHVFERQG